MRESGFLALYRGVCIYIIYIIVNVYTRGICIYVYGVTQSHYANNINAYTYICFIYSSSRIPAALWHLLGAENMYSIPLHVSVYVIDPSKKSMVKTLIDHSYALPVCVLQCFCVYTYVLQRRGYTCMCVVWQLLILILIHSYTFIFSSVYMCLSLFLNISVTVQWLPPSKIVVPRTKLEGVRLLLCVFTQTHTHTHT